MRLNIFIAKRLSRGNKKDFSRPIIRIAIACIAISVCVMIIAVGVMTGYKTEITTKTSGFGAHIQVNYFDYNQSYEFKPINKNQDFYKTITQEEGIEHIQAYALKAGIIKAETEVQGVVVKGIGNDFNWDFFNSKIIEGKSFNISNSSISDSVIISKSLANLLNLHLQEKLKIYFYVEGEVQPRGRALFISGIYETGLADFDDKFILCDIQHIQKLNGWDSTQISGFEIFIDDIKDLDKLTEVVNNNINYELKASSIKELYPEIFDWMALFDMNVFVILLLMAIVATINMISTLLIMILEKSSTIGIFKTLGMTSKNIRRIFSYKALWLIFQGLIYGNLVAIVISFIQNTFRVIKLDPESYYVSIVPIHINFTHVILIDIATVVICMLSLLIPSILISKINPVKTIAK